MVSSVDFMVEENHTPADLRLVILTLEDRLRNLGIDVVEKPEYIDEFVVDEKRFETLLIEKYSNDGNGQKSRQRQHDVDSVAAIFRLRKGKPFHRIEHCRGVFVTNNVALARASNKFFGERDHEIAHCLTDFTLSNLLWLAQPDALPELPRRQIIADAYAATQPDSRLWEQYVSKIEALKTRGDISADDYFSLRFAQEARSSLMEITLGVRHAITEGTIRDVMQSTRAKIQAEGQRDAVRNYLRLQQHADRETQSIQAQLDNERSLNQAMVEASSTALMNTRTRARIWSGRAFALIRLSLNVTYIPLLLVGAPLSEISTAVDDQSAAIKAVIGIIWVFFTFVILIQFNDGSSLRHLLDRTEIRFAKFLERKLIEMAK